MEARHDWWLRELRVTAKYVGRGFGGVTIDPAACQAALDWIAEREAEVSDVDSLCDAIAAEGRVLTIDDVEDMLTRSEEVDGPSQVRVELLEWLAEAKAERDASPVH